MPVSVCLSVCQMVYDSSDAQQDGSVKISGQAEAVRLFQRSCSKASRVDPTLT